LVEDFVQSQVALVLGHPSRSVPRAQGFANLGLNSLGAIELRRRMQQGLDCGLPSTVAFDYPTVESLVTYLIDEVIRLDFQPVAPPPNAVSIPDDRLAELSGEDIATLLAQELQMREDGENL
jgi:acyl carrier protein